MQSVDFVLAVIVLVAGPVIGLGLGKPPWRGHQFVVLGVVAGVVGAGALVAAGFANKQSGFEYLRPIAAYAAFLLLGFFIGGTIGRTIAYPRGRGTAGFWFGALLGVLGWIIAALLPASTAVQAVRNRDLAQEIARGTAAAPGDDERDCPWCAERIKSAAIVCRFCGRDVAVPD